MTWGDSLTEGGQGISDTGKYPSDLEKALAPVQVVNEGIGGQTSTQIGVREGGVQTTVAVAGGAIPASGPVAMSFPVGYEPANAHGPFQGVPGTIAGVHGMVTYSQGGFLFTRDAAGSSAVSVPSATAFVVDTPYADSIPIFWEGTNNYFDPGQVESDLAAQVATVKTNQYLVLSVMSQNSGSQWLGAPEYEQIISLNNALASIYGSHFIDIRKILVDSYNPDLLTDMSDYNHDEPPTSLRAQLGTGTLTGSIGAADTSLTVNMGSGTLAAGYILTIDTGANTENVFVRSVVGNVATVYRSFGGNNTSHATGVQVIETDPMHLNAQGYQIVANAIAAALSKPY